MKGRMADPAPPESTAYRRRRERKPEGPRSGLDGTRLLREVANAARLAEGPEGVWRVLRTVIQGGVVPLRDVSHRVGLPVPAVSAVRRELEKRGLPGLRRHKRKLRPVELLPVYTATAHR